MDLCSPARADITATLPGRQRLAKARIAADRPGREVATWLLTPRQMVVLCALLDARRTGQARRLQLVDANEVEIAECGP
jgi:hypothetical protein